jgi:hypothetical protein
VTQFPQRKGHEPLLLEPHGLALEVIERMLEAGKRCFLCDGPPFAAYAWIPAQPGVPASRERSYWALLCAACLALPDGIARVEAGLKREVARDLAMLNAAAHGRSDRPPTS